MLVDSMDGHVPYRSSDRFRDLLPKEVVGGRLQEAPVHGTNHVTGLTVREDDSLCEEWIVNRLQRLDPSATQRMANRRGNVAGEGCNLELGWGLARFGLAAGQNEPQASRDQPEHRQSLRIALQQSQGLVDGHVEVWFGRYLTPGGRVEQVVAIHLDLPFRILVGKFLHDLTSPLS